MTFTTMMVVYGVQLSVSWLRKNTKHFSDDEIILYANHSGNLNQESKSDVEICFEEIVEEIVDDARWDGIGDYPELWFYVIPHDQISKSENFNKDDIILGCCLREFDFQEGVNLQPIDKTNDQETIGKVDKLLKKYNINKTPHEYYVQDNCACCSSFKN